MSQSPLIQPRPLGPRVRDVTAPPDPPFTGFISKLQVIWKTLTAHLKDRDNPHGVTKAQVGLGNVDNTPDADKPVSRAAAAELAAAKSYAAGLVNDEAEARAAAVSALDAAKAAKATTLAGYGITDAKIANGVITLGANSIIPLTSHQPLTAYVTGGTYDSASKKILLKHGSTTLAEIDATAFIKDGMVSSVAISGGSLVITFNTDAGKDPVSIPLTDIFDPDNYYNKTAADTKFVAKEEGKGLSTNDYTDEDKVALAGKQNALSAQQLANISAVPGKADKAELPYALAAAEKSNGAYALADRTVSYHTLDTEPGIDFSGTPSISGYIQQDGHDGFFPITSTEVIDFNELRCIIKANYDGGYVYVEAPPLNSDYPRAFEVSGTDEYLRVVAEWDVTGDSHSPFWGSGTAYPSMSSVELQCANGMTVFIPVKWGEVTVPLSFPAATSRKSRDFYFALNVPSGATAPTVTAPGGVTLLNEFGAAFSFAVAPGWNVWHFTEFSPGLFRVESCGGASAIKAAISDLSAVVGEANTNLEQALGGGS